MKKTIVDIACTSPFLFSTMILQIYWRLCKCWTDQSVQTALISMLNRTNTMSDFRSAHSSRRLKRIKDPPNHPEKKMKKISI